MDRLLDKEIHQLLKSPILPSYYVANPGRNNNSSNNNNNLNQPEQQQQIGKQQVNPLNLWISTKLGRT